MGLRDLGIKALSAALCPSPLPRFSLLSPSHILQVATKTKHTHFKTKSPAKTATKTTKTKSCYSQKNSNHLDLDRISSLSQLSPAEKLDLLNFRFDYPAVFKERERVGLGVNNLNNPPEREYWDGMCDGLIYIPYIYIHMFIYLITKPSGSDP